MVEEDTGTAPIAIFPKFWNITESSKRPSKSHLSINLLAGKKTAFLLTQKLALEFCRRKPKILVF